MSAAGQQVCGFGPTPQLWPEDAMFEAMLFPVK
jgi:hypothetical protein